MISDRVQSPGYYISSNQR